MSHGNESCHMGMSHVTWEWVMSYGNESCHMGMSHVTWEWVMSHGNESCAKEELQTRASYRVVKTHRRPIRSLKLQVIFRKRATNHRALLRKHEPLTGWRRPIGSLKLQVSLRKRATHYRALLRKMTHKDKAPCGTWPPCIPTAPHACI